MTKNFISSSIYFLFSINTIVTGINTMPCLPEQNEICHPLVPTARSI